MQDAFAALNALLLQEGITYTLIFSGVTNCLVPAFLFSAFFSASWLITSWLSQTVAIVLKKNYTQKVMDSHAYYGFKFIKRNKQKINFSVTLNSDIQTLCNDLMHLTNDLFSKFLNFTVGIYQLGRLSGPLMISVLSLSFAIPAYMLFAAIMYSVGYSILITLLDKGLQKLTEKLKKQEDAFLAHLHHIEEHSESIAFKKGATLERDKLLKYIDKFSKYQYATRRIHSAIHFIQNISVNLTNLWGLVLSAPGIIAKTLSPNHIFSIAYYFTCVVDFFSWVKNNAENLTAFNTSLQRVSELQSLLNEWGAVKKDNLTVIRKPHLFGVESLNLSTPSGNTIFDKVSFEIPMGKSIVLRGPSGIGKTTLFRSVAQLWPYVEGKIIFPSEKPEITIYYIPQQTYFPLKSTLLEAICYPHLPTKENKEKIIVLMQELGFKKETICNLEKKMDKGNDQLSQGEQQRVAIMGAIIQAPDVLLMDEGTNGLDLKTKQICRKMIRQRLPHATIISIDHHATSDQSFQPLYDYQIKMKPSHSHQSTLPTDERRTTIRVRAFPS